SNMGVVAPGGTGLPPQNSFDTAGNMLSCYVNCPINPGPGCEGTPCSGLYRQIDHCDNNYGVFAGTSFASPMVAAGAALVWAANPSLTGTQVIQVLQGTAVQKVGSQGTWNNTTGWGLIDLCAAVSQSLAMPTNTPTFTATMTPTNTATNTPTQTATSTATT